MTLSRRSLLSGMALATGFASPAFAARKSNKINNLQTLIDNAVEADGVLHLPAGNFKASNLTISASLRITGVAGRTRLIGGDDSPVLRAAAVANVTLTGLTFVGGPFASKMLVSLQDIDQLIIEDCSFEHADGGGLWLEGCSGRVTGNHFSKIDKAAIFSRDARGLEISGNTIEDIGNNGIQVWTSKHREDGTIVSRNRVSRVGANDGGSGQNGNGINIFRAGNVIVSENRITDCKYSGVRCNAGNNCMIINNSISRMGEVAIYCEFGYLGAVVSGNIIEDTGLGISITNFNEGGRLATVANNVIRRAKGGGTIPETMGIGIGAEADTTVTGNVVEEARDVGISLGWGAYARGLSATGNLVRNAPRGIVFSTTAGADAVLIANNRITGATIAGVSGADHGSITTGELGLAGAEPPSGGQVSGNVIN